MNKTAIKNYAIWARVQLIESAKQRAFEYEITDGGENQSNLEVIGGRLLTKEERTQRKQLIAEIKQKGYTQVMEEAAYTWFNRFIALRFMEVNGYLPSKIRVFTDENGAFKPEILKEAMTVELEGLDRSKVLDLLDKQDNEALYKYLLIAQCNALNSGLPYMFEKISNWTELLFPANLLRGDSILGRMISDIPEEDWTDQVQIIGWLYQYYNTELKDDTFALLKKNIKISKERIPAATQLFTPDWIVRYMVENSLGRLWLEGHPDAKKRFLPTKDERDAYAAGQRDLKETKWYYYLEEAEQEPEVQSQLNTMRTEYSKLRPEDIKIVDPCIGSGHILAYAFDVLMQIYESNGYTPHEAATLIVEKNLYGVDIDYRAYQLAYFSIMMKGRQYDRRFFTRGVTPCLAYSKPVYNSPKAKNIFGDKFASFLDNCAFADVAGLGSLRSSDYYTIDNMHRILRGCDTFQYDLFDRDEIIRMCDTAAAGLKLIDLLSQEYDVVVTNPPYMTLANMSPKLSDYVKKYYPDSKADLFAVFMERCAKMVKSNGYQAMITQHAWMFLSSFEKLRGKLLQTDTVNMAHLGARAFEEIGGEVVQTTSFVLRKSHMPGYKGTYCRLIEPTTQQGKENMFLSGENRFTAAQDNFSKIPGSPVAYWVSDAFYSIFEKDTIGNHFDVKAGICTGKNDEFILQWQEVDFTKSSMISKNYRYTPHNKGGEYRKWYGNREVFLKYNDKALEMMENNAGFRHDGKEYYFQPHIGWSKIASTKSSFRYFEDGFTFDSAGLGLFSDRANMTATLALLNSRVVEHLISILNPTLNVTPMIVKRLPYADVDVTHLSERCITLSKEDWDSFETSWDFRKHPLVPSPREWADQRDSQFAADRIAKFSRLSWHYENWESECQYRFDSLKANEEELNRIFIDIYGLQDELTPEVEDRDVTVRKADLGRDIRSLISYAVGCMFGRYSLDEPGLAYAGGEWDASKYATFPADKDNIIPICDDDYFDDDITGRFVKWVETVYGSETLEENLKFIADALGGKGTPREVIRSYFINGFYADHLKTYQKRPIYWLFSSGKKNGFKALIYMHRYQPDLLARMRTDYVHEQQERYRTQIQMLEDRLQTAAPSERVKLNKQTAKLKEQALEIQKYEEKLHHLADQMIELDLDDGVKVNYAKFQDVLEKIK